MTNAEDLAHQPSPSIAPTPRLSSRGLFIALALTCILPLTALSIYAAVFGRAIQNTLDVKVTLERQLVPTVNGVGAIPTDVVRIENQTGHDVPNLTVDLNGQYFMYQDSPLADGETITLPQNIFATKSNQRFVPGRYRIEDVTVTGRLPSGARGVIEVPFDENGQQVLPARSATE